MLSTIVILLLLAIVVTQNRALLYGNWQKLKQAWGIGAPPTPPAA